MSAAPHLLSRGRNAQRTQCRHRCIYLCIYGPWVTRGTLLWAFAHTSYSGGSHSDGLGGSQSPQHREGSTACDLRQEMPACPPPCLHSLRGTGVHTGAARGHLGDQDRLTDIPNHGVTLASGTPPPPRLFPEADSAPGTAGEDMPPWPCLQPDVEKAPSWGLGPPRLALTSSGTTCMRMAKLVR